MRKILLSIIIVLGAALASTSCRMAPSHNLGDTVSAKVFEPADTSARVALGKGKKVVPIKDSADIYIIGEASTRTTVQLLSYPSRRDTAIYAKGKHIKVTGNADYGHAVRAKFWISDAGDTLVTRLEEYLAKK